METGPPPDKGAIGIPVTALRCLRDNGWIAMSPDELLDAALAAETLAPTLPGVRWPRRRLPGDFPATDEQRVAIEATRGLLTIWLSSPDTLVRGLRFTQRVLGLRPSREEDDARYSARRANDSVRESVYRHSSYEAGGESHSIVHLGEATKRRRS
jgi:hypothetical protein